MIEYSGRDKRLSFYEYDKPFNYSEINNFGVELAKGSQVLLLNVDIKIITPQWIENLLEHSQRPEVGAVGAKLYYPNETVQHAGIFLGLCGIAGHSHKNWPRQNPGLNNRISVIQNVSAVTGACLMVKKELYRKIGGMDKVFAINCNDVDFCLRLRQLGYLNVFTPYCEAYHSESKVLGYNVTVARQNVYWREVESFRQRYRKILRQGDPFYNPNLFCGNEQFQTKRWYRCNFKWQMKEILGQKIPWFLSCYRKILKIGNNF